MHCRTIFLVALATSSFLGSAYGREPIARASQVAGATSQTLQISGGLISPRSPKTPKTKGSILINGGLSTVQEAAEDSASYELRLGTGPVAIPQIIRNFQTNERFYSVDLQIRKSPGSDDFPLIHSGDFVLSYDPERANYIGHDIPNPEYDFGDGISEPQWEIIGSDGQFGIVSVTLLSSFFLAPNGLSPITVTDNWHTLGRLWFRAIDDGDTTIGFGSNFSTQLYDPVTYEAIEPASLAAAIAVQGGTLPAGFGFEHTAPSPEGFYGASISLQLGHSYSAGSVATAFQFFSDNGSFADFNTFGVDPLLPPPFDQASIGLNIWSSVGSPWMLVGLSGDGLSFYGLTTSSNPGADFPMVGTQSSQYMIQLAP